MKIIPPSPVAQENPKTEIFLTSLLVLFLELALIRFLPSQIAYLGYYSNFILLASFVGMGGGIILAKHPYNLIRFFPWALVITIGLASFLTVSALPGPGGDIHFTSNSSGFLIPEIFLVPIVFILVAITIACLSQRLGQLFNTLPPLRAYSWDILGSLTGIALFTGCSYLRLNPFIWFSIFTAIFIITRWKYSRSWLTLMAPLILVLLVLIPTTRGARWSPYQKVTYEPLYESNGSGRQLAGYHISVNNIQHQGITNDLNRLDDIYPLPYTSFQHPEYQNALIIGAGSGTDVAVALAHNVKHIDAVEIDPELLRLGYEINPHQPYQDSRVTTYVDDARSFLQKNDTKYDLIIFALPDSLILASGRGNIRLESFLFTQEAFASAQSHLTDNGLLVMYNYYRRPWLVTKLAGMLRQTFQQEPYVVTFQSSSELAALMVGNKLSDLSPEAPPSLKIETTPQSATDDWPFVYLQKPSLPWFYLVMLTIIAILIYSSLSMLNGRTLYTSIEPTYFFLGVAFMLLETVSLVRFSLLFGSTWVVNSLVFFAILSLILVAIRLSARLKNLNPTPWYIGLGLSLLVQYLYPLQTLLALPSTTKYVLVSLLTLLPIFFANIIFSLTFKKSTANSTNFASNILGAAAGGMLEYSALLMGYRNISLIIILCYALAFLAPLMKSRRNGSVITKTTANAPK